MLRLSPDERHLAVTVKTLKGRVLSVIDLTRPAPLVPLTTEGEVLYLMWRRGAQELVFLWLTDGRIALVTQPANGTAPPELLAAGRIVPSSVGPDGRIAAMKTTGTGDWDIVTRL